MSGDHNVLAKVVGFLKRFKSWIIYGLPAAVALFWISVLSETFVINIFALKSAVFVYVAVWFVTAIAHTVLTVMLDFRLQKRDSENRVPKATARRSGAEK